jgi:acyl dehydratase
MGMGDDNPLYHDEKYAESAVTGGIVAPPVFLYTSFMTPLLFASDSPVRSSGGGFPGMQGLYTGCRWHFDRVLRPGDHVASKRTRVGVVDVFNRAEGDFIGPEDDIETAVKSAHDINPADGGPLVLQVEDHRAYFDDGSPVGYYHEYLTRLEPERVDPKKGKYRNVKERHYTAEEMDSIEDHYGKEAAQRRGAETRYWEDVSPGEELFPLIKGPLTILSYLAWAAGHAGWFQLTDRVLYNFVTRFQGSVKRNPDSGIWSVPEEMHWDPYVAKLLSMPVPFDIGGQRTPQISHLVTDWMGDAGRLTDMSLWFHRPLFLSETMWIRGKVVSKSPVSATEGSVSIELLSETFDKELLTTGSAIVTLPRQS